MRYSCALLAFPLLFAFSSFASPVTKDSNVVISTANETHQFVYNKKQNRVEIKQDLSVSYLCNSFRTALPVVERYDNETTIDNVDIYVDGKAQKNIKPSFEYYSVDNTFFSDAHVCFFELPLQKQGAVGQVKFQKTVIDPRYFTSIYFTEGYKILNKQVVIKVPRWMRVELKEMNFAGYNISKTTAVDAKTDEDIYTYSLTNVPAQEREGNSPGPSYLYPHLLIMAKSATPPEASFTYFNTVKDQYAWYRGLVKSVDNDAASIKTKAEEITAGKTLEADKVKAIFYWVQNNIRYIAFEDGLAGFKPERAHEVLRRKYGDCKGMAHLTKELLKSIGLDARLCWIGTNHIAYDYSTPSMSVDNHMICALNSGGKMQFLDATETYSSLNEYAERIQGRQVLVEDGENFILTHVPTTTYQQNLDAEKAVVNIEGTLLKGQVELEWRGEEKENILTQLNGIKKDKSKDAFMNFLSNSNKDYEVKNLATSNLDDIDKNLTAKYDLSFKNGVSSFGKEYYVDLDYRKEFNGFVFKTDERVHDYWLPYKTNTVKEVQLNIPAGYEVTSLPAPIAVKNNNYEFNIAYQQSAGKVVYKKSIIIKNPRIAKAAFAQWNKDIETLSKAYNEQVVLTAK